MIYWALSALGFDASW